MRIITSTADALDFCSRHAPGETLAAKRYANLGDGPDERGNCFSHDAEHPDYDGDYRCWTCRCVLTEND